jgi:hypothetical protein
VKTPVPIMFATTKFVAVRQDTFFVGMLAVSVGLLVEIWPGYKRKVRSLMTRRRNLHE